jgi:hypothetical protein
VGLTWFLTCSSRNGLVWGGGRPRAQPVQVMTKPSTHAHTYNPIIQLWPLQAGVRTMGEPSTPCMTSRTSDGDLLATAAGTHATKPPAGPTLVKLMTLEHVQVMRPPGLGTRLLSFGSPTG